MENLKITSPWIHFVNELQVLFERDSDVRIEYSDEERTVKLYVENAVKADALSRLMPTEKTFGNFTLKITVIPANEKETTAQLFCNAFHGNGAFSRMISVPAPGGGTFDYMCFAREVAQYYDDNLADPNGYVSTLYQNIAADIFEDRDGVFFCTENACFDF